MSNHVSPEEGDKSNSNSSSCEAVTTAVNSLEDTGFTCHIYDGSEGAIRLPEPKAKPLSRKQNVVDGSTDNRSNVNSVKSFFSRMRIYMGGNSKTYNTIPMHLVFQANLELLHVRCVISSENTYTQHPYKTMIY